MASIRNISQYGSWEKQPCRIDISGWEKQIKDVKKTAAKVCIQVVDLGLDRLFKRTIEHVTAPGTPYRENYYIEKNGKKYKRTRSKRGPLTNAGKLPIPIVTGQLRRSIKSVRFNAVFGAVWSDPRIAKHNVFVHFGTKAMLPRPFLQAAVDIERPIILESMKKRILSEIQQAAGQKEFNFE